MIWAGSIAANAKRIERQTRIEDAVLRLLDEGDMTLNEIAIRLHMNKSTLKTRDKTPEKTTQNIL